MRTDRGQKEVKKDGSLKEKDEDGGLQKKAKPLTDANKKNHYRDQGVLKEPQSLGDPWHVGIKSTEK